MPDDPKIPDQEPEEDMGTLDGVLPKGIGTLVHRLSKSRARQDERADDRVDAAHTSTRRILWAVIAAQFSLIAMLVAAVLVLSGHAVGLDLTGWGSFSGE